MSGSAIAMPEVHELADAVLWAWYPGEQGGHAVADVLFGDYSPSGKLPLTIYQSTDQLGDFEDYNISQGGWTYRYFEGQPLYPFGFGLSYNAIEYKKDGSDEAQMKADGSIQIDLSITNKGVTIQNESVQLYVSKSDAGFLTPICALKDIQSIVLGAGETTNVSFIIDKETLAQINMDGQKVLPVGEYKLFIGSSSPSDRLPALNGMIPLEYNVEVIE
ncbi:MAG: glycoside hydrolase family 3 C-terminal domain-containing protein, partial [Bacteroidales bacterium]|nr:glycoside hydrolase family 3 C-terminal domain-containing protein [Bacteroidales bacterium]